jgi:hypothetical protein
MHDIYPFSIMMPMINLNYQSNSLLFHNSIHINYLEIFQQSIGDSLFDFIQCQSVKYISHMTQNPL